MDNNLINFIENLSIKKNIFPLEVRFYITNKIYILIEMEINVFVVDENFTMVKNRYTNIKSIDEIIDVVLKKTNINLNVFMRNIKINKILNGK